MKQLERIPVYMLPKNNLDTIAERCKIYA